MQLYGSKLWGGFRPCIARSRWWWLALAALAYLPVAWRMFGDGSGSLAAVHRACGGLTPFDMRGWWSVHDARAMMTACGPAGRSAYVHQQLLDLLYPGTLAAVLLLATALLLRRYHGRWWQLLLPAVAMTVLDYVENAGVWTLLLDWPDMHPTVIAISGTATAVKRVLGFVAFTIPLVLAAAAVIGALRQAAAHDHGGTDLTPVPLAPQAAGRPGDRRSHPRHTG